MFKWKACDPSWKRWKARYSHIISCFQPSVFLSHMYMQLPNPFRDSVTEVRGRASPGLAALCQRALLAFRRRDSTFTATQDSCTLDQMTLQRVYTGSTDTVEFVLCLCPFLCSPPTGRPSKIMTCHSIRYPATDTSFPWNASSFFCPSMKIQSIL